MEKKTIEFWMTAEKPDGKVVKWNAYIHTSDGEFEVARMFFRRAMAWWRDLGYPGEYIEVDNPKAFAGDDSIMQEIATVYLGEIFRIIVDARLTDTGSLKIFSNLESRKRTPEGPIDSFSIGVGPRLRERALMHQAVKWDWEKKDERKKKSKGRKKEG